MHAWVATSQLLTSFKVRIRGYRHCYKGKQKRYTVSCRSRFSSSLKPPAVEGVNWTRFVVSANLRESGPLRSFSQAHILTIRSVW